MIQFVAGLVLLYFGREVFIPVALAMVLAIVLRPVVRRLEQRRIPAPVGGGGLIVAGLAIVWGIGYILTPPVQNFVRELPDVARAASTKLETLPRPLDRLGTMLASGTASLQHIDSTTQHPDSVAQHTAPTGKNGNRSAGASAAGAGPSPGSVLPIVTRVFGTAAGAVSLLVEITLLLLFFLAAGSSVRDRLVAHGRGSPVARGLVAIGDELQSIVGRYLSLLALINLGQGIVIAIAMALIGMPAAPVWGAMAFVAEFFPYLGSATMVVLLTVVGIASSNGPSVLLAPAIYLVMTTIQNSIVSPVTYARSLKLNPAAILVSVMVWFALWGVPGAFLAVPILATIRVVCDRVKGNLAALGALIEE